MTIIDFTAQMAPAGAGIVALLAIAIAGIGSCLDERERVRLQASAETVGAWWFRRGAAPDRHGVAERRRVATPRSTAPERRLIPPRASA